MFTDFLIVMRTNPHILLKSITDVLKNIIISTHTHTYKTGYIIIEDAKIVFRFKPHFCTLSYSGINFCYLGYDFGN